MLLVLPACQLAVPLVTMRHLNFHKSPPATSTWTRVSATHNNQARELDVASFKKAFGVSRAAYTPRFWKGSFYTSGRIIRLFSTRLPFRFRGCESIQNLTKVNPDHLRMALLRRCSRLFTSSAEGWLGAGLRFRCTQCGRCCTGGRERVVWVRLVNKASICSWCTAHKFNDYFCRSLNKKRTR